MKIFLQKIMAIFHIKYACNCDYCVKYRLKSKN